MASNPAVEKLKALGLKHGEKAVVGLATIMFFLFVVLAIGRKSTIDFEPQDLAKRAEQADSNLNARQKPEEILVKLTEAGIKPQTDFEATVVRQQSKALDPKDYLVKNRWVTPEPGAGLIRDTPELIAPTDLYAFPNRGGYNLFAINEKGDRIIDDGKSVTKRPTRYGKSRRQQAGMMGGMSGGSGMRSGGNNSAKSKAAAEAERLRAQDKLNKALVGEEDEKKVEKEKAAAPAVEPNYKEVIKGLRSVVITGKLDNKKLKANYLTALKRPELAYPNYLRLNVQRRTMTPDGKWTEFAAVDSDANLNVLDNLTEEDEELVRADALLDALVDPLPFPKAGYWAGVHVASLVPKDRREIPKAQQGGGFGGMSGMGMMPGGSSMQGSGMPGGGGGKLGGMSGMGMMPGGSSMQGGGGMGMVGGGLGGSSANGPVDETDFQKSESDEVMIRSIDFTVQPDATYQYRVQIVVLNPNHLHNDVSPGTNTDDKELLGPWSEPSGDVSVPPDVSAYAMNKTPENPRRDDQIKFQIARWNPEDGHTVTRDDDAGPGELIGNPASTPIPSSEGRGSVAKLVDFNSRQFVLDTMGGLLPASPAIKATAKFDDPAISLVLRPDGIVAVHSQFNDRNDPVRVDMERGYKRALKDSAKPRQRRMMGSGMGSGMSGGR